MSTPSTMPAVVTLRSSLRTIDEQLGTGALAPEQVEDVESAIDDIRFRIWGVLAAKSPTEYRVFRERFRPRRATEICQGLAADIGDGLPAQREGEELRAALQTLFERMSTGADG